MKSGWEIKKLGEVCEVVLGGTPRTSVSEYWGGSVPWLTPGDMGKIQGLYVNKTSRTLTPKGLENGSRLFPANSVILSTRAPIGYVLINSVPMCTNQGCKTIVPDSAIMPKFLAYNLIGRAIELNELGTGTTFKELATGVLKNIPIPIPSLAEQKRIVEKIDAAFEKIDKLKANAERNLANAKELFQSALDEAMRPKDGCNFVSLTSVSEKIFAGGDKPEIIVKESTENIKIPIYSNGENNDGLYGYTQYATVVKPAVTVSARGTIGFCSIRRVPYVPIVRLISVIPNDKVLLEYLYYSLKSLKIKNTGSSIPQLTVPMIKEFHLPMRPLSEQREIVNRLDLLAEKIKMLEQNYTQQIADCVEMRQAVLREAFEGRL